LAKYDKNNKPVANAKNFFNTMQIFIKYSTNDLFDNDGFDAQWTCKEGIVQIFSLY
jgi:hypothetical protein